MADLPSFHSGDQGASLRDLRKQRHSIDLVFVLLVLAAFIVVGTLLIELGTGIYSRILNTMTDNATQRTTVAYVRQKVRSATGSDSDEAVTIASLSENHTDGSEGSLPALLLRQDIGGDPYELYLYVYDGSMRELLVREGNDQVPVSAGTKILDCDEMALTQETDAILVTVTNQNEKISFLIDQ